MPYMYVSKVNYNSKIYDVYNKNIKIEDILDEVFNKLTNNKSIKYNKDAIYTYEDVRGIKCKKLVTEEYFFNNLEKNEEDKTILGTIIRQYPRYSERFDDELGELISQTIVEASEIRFYFDVKNELIAFCTRNKFGYNQFNEAFKYLLEISCSNQGFEVFLKKDQNKVQEAINNFKRIDKIVATVIPPNANNEINELLADSSIPLNNNIAKARLEYDASPLNENGIDKQGKLIQGLVKTAALGYGDLNIHGKHNNDSYVVFKSNKEAPITGMINDDSDKNEFVSAAKAIFLSILTRKE